MLQGPSNGSISELARSALGVLYQCLRSASHREITLPASNKSTGLAILGGPEAQTLGWEQLASTGHWLSYVTVSIYLHPSEIRKYIMYIRIYSGFLVSFPLKGTKYRNLHEFKQTKKKKKFIRTCIHFLQSCPPCTWYWTTASRIYLE